MENDPRLLAIKIDNINVWFRTIIENFNNRFSELNYEISLLKKRVEELERNSRSD